METRGILCWLSIVLTVLMVLHAAAAETQAPPSGYRIGPNDVIRIQVFGEDDLTVEGRVGGDGKLDYPLLGVLQVGGKTTHDLQAILTKRFGRRVCAVTQGHGIHRPPSERVCQRGGQSAGWVSV
jgi:polysaccharide export outer membrane protein